MKLKALVVMVAAVFAAVMLSSAPANTVTPQRWWNSSWHYRMGIDTNTTSFSRTDWPIEADVNFTDVLRQMNRTGTLDENSTRVIEYNSTGDVVGERTSQFDKAGNYNATTNAVMTVVFSLNGTNGANTARNFFLYFDTTENGQKLAASYPTDIAYSWNGKAATVNNSKFKWGIDTNRGENTSGLSRAEGTSLIVFNVPASQRTAEYSEYTNGTHNLTFDLRNNATFANGSVRLVLTQQGDEVVFNSTTRTNLTRIIKTYTFYANLPWIKVEQNITNLNSTNITRRSPEGGALAFDAERVLGVGSLFFENLTEPGSWVMSSPPGVATVAYINVNETGTNNFFGSNQSKPGRIGIQLNSTVMQPNQSVKQVSVLYFDDLVANDTAVEILKRALLDPPSVSVQGGESWLVNVSPQTDFQVYNRNDTILLSSNANGTFDMNDIVRLANATLDMGTAGAGDDQTIELNDNGTNGDQAAGDQVFSRRFNLSTNDTAGAWNLTVKEYDIDGNLLNQSSRLFNVSSQYNVNQTLLTSPIIAGLFVNGSVTVSNVRNDIGIGAAALNCTFGQLNVTNITDNSNGNYSINFTAPSSPGTYALNCTASKFNNTGTDIDNFVVESATTNMSITPSPPAFNATQISQNASQGLNVSINLTNFGNGTAFSANLSVSLPANWTANITQGQCGNIASSQSCLISFAITIANKTVPGLYGVNLTANWTNPDNSPGGNQSQVTINVSSNPILNIAEALLSDNVSDGLS
ncbi:MAG: hypothetical protein HY367_01695, partial [Candidatus Aenigmarchaeota archaeon]|nr:hypothetical protein [Candidatus Aenigmarchaeota archaeon]